MHEDWIRESFAAGGIEVEDLCHPSPDEHGHSEVSIAQSRANFGQKATG